MSTISPYLRLTLIGTSEQAGTWGTTTNNNFQYGFENAIAGYYPKTVVAGNNYIAIVDGAQTAGAEYPNASYKLSGAGAAYTLYLPPYENKYSLWNNTAFSATIICATAANGITAASTATASFSSAATSITLTPDANVVIAVGMTITGTGIPANTIISAYGTGTGGAGTYTISNATTLSSAGTYTLSLVIPARASITLSSDGYNVFESTNSTAGNFTVGGTLSGQVATFAKDSAFTSTGSLGIPVGTTAQRTLSAAGSTSIRYNTTLSRFEGYDVNGTTWNTIGGGATGGGANQVFYENGQSITANYTVPVGKNAMTTGTVTIISFAGTAAASSNTTLNILTTSGGGSLYVGAVIAGTGVPLGTTITAFGTGSGGVGTYTVSNTLSTAANAAITSDVVVTVSNGSRLVVI